MLPTAETALVVLYGLGVCDTATGAWGKYWKHWGGRNASGSQVACSEIDSLFVRCRKEGDYQRRLAGLLANVRRQPEVLTLVAIDLSVLPEDLGWSYVLARRAYWVQEFQFEVHVQERQK